MDEEAPPLLNEPTGDATTRSLAADLRQLAEDGRTFVEAELAFHKSRAAVAGIGAKGVASWGALALALVFFALMALVMGALLALAPLLGDWGAMLAVTLGLLLLSALAGSTALRRWRRMQALLGDTSGRDQG